MVAISLIEPACIATENIVIFIDRQLAGPYGWQDGLRPPFAKGTKEQGPQDEAGPAEQYRSDLVASIGIAEHAMDCGPVRVNIQRPRPRAVDDRNIQSLNGCPVVGGIPDRATIPHAIYCHVRMRSAAID
jgi:hypothetical protein